MKKYFFVCLVCIICVISLISCDSWKDAEASDTEPFGVELIGISKTLDIDRPQAISSHGGHQTRVCRTEHGSYAAYVSSQDGKDYYFFIVKMDGENSAVLRFDRCPADAALVNIAQDNNGDVYVTAFPVNTWESTSPENAWLGIYKIDGKTDKVTKIKHTQQFSDVCSGGYGYAMPMFDFDNRKIYAIYTGVNDPGQFAWFTYDIDSGKWEDSCITASFEEKTHSYLYCFPDGNGGAMIVAERDIPVEWVSELKFENGTPAVSTFLWDQLDLFIIPDMTVGYCEMVPIHTADYSRGDEGIAPITTNNQGGDVFLDSRGLLHVVYTTYFLDYDLASGGDSDIRKFEIRHAIYDGKECIYNEPLNLDKGAVSYGVRMTENTNGELFLIAVTLGYNEAEHLEIYRALDESGKEWNLEKHTALEGIKGVSFSISCKRNNSLCDNTVDCLLFADYYEGEIHLSDLFIFKINID